MTDDPAPGHPRSERAPVRIDLSGATLEQRGAVLEHLRTKRHYHEVRGDFLIVQARDEAEVRPGSR